MMEEASTSLVNGENGGNTPTKVNTTNSLLTIMCEQQKETTEIEEMECTQDTNGQWSTVGNKRKILTSSDNESVKSNRQKPPKKQKSRDDNTTNVVFIAGTSKNITKIHPLDIKRKIIKALCTVEKIYVSGKDSLKIYCLNEEQRKKALEMTNLDDIEVKIRFFFVYFCILFCVNLPW